MNIPASVDSKRLSGDLKSFRMHTYEKAQEGGAVMVNQVTVN